MPPRWKNYSQVSPRKIFENFSFSPVIQAISTGTLRQGLSTLQDSALLKQFLPVAQYFLCHTLQYHFVHHKFSPSRLWILFSLHSLEYTIFKYLIQGLTLHALWLVFLLLCSDFPDLSARNCTCLLANCWSYPSINCLKCITYIALGLMYRLNTSINLGLQSTSSFTDILAIT